MLLSILIPTLNRSKELIINVKKILSYINKLAVTDKVEIIISDNGSDYENRILIEKELVCLNVSIFFQNENIGFENNMLFLLEKAHGTYAMTLGDDDYFSVELFGRILFYLEQGNVSAVFSNYVRCDAQGKRIGSNPYFAIPTDDYIFGIDEIYRCYLAHKMSCQTFLTEGVLEAYTSLGLSTDYPQIFFMGYGVAKGGKAVYITQNPIINTVLEKRNFDYSYDNLMGDICVAFDKLPKRWNRIKQYILFVQKNNNRYINKITIRHPFETTCRILKTYKCSITFKIVLVGMFWGYFVKGKIKVGSEGYESSYISRGIWNKNI